MVTNAVSVEALATSQWCILSTVKHW